MQVAASFLRKHRYLMMQVLVVPALTAAAIAYTHSLPLPVPTKIAVDCLLLGLAVVHIDLTDGGLLSRVVYSLSSSYGLRNVVTVAAAFGWAMVLVALTRGVAGPLVLVFVIPLALAALRGGLKLGLVSTALLTGGLLVAFAQRGGPSTTAELTMAGMLCLIGVALGVLVGRLRRVAHDLSALYETGRAISSSLKLDETLPLVLNIVMLDLRADVSLLVLLDDETRAPRIEAQRGLSQETVAELELAEHDVIVDYVIGGANSICVNQRHSEPTISALPGLGSVLAVPLVVEGRAVGALVAGCFEEHAFSRNSIRFMEALASQAATAIENGRLFGQARDWAVRDGLTGLFNYRYFDERINEEVARAQRYGGSSSLIMIDIDLFKRVNDTYGHLEGDEVLRQVGRLIQKETRETDTVARYGGEEFAIILPQTSLDHAVAAAEKLRAVVAGHDFIAGQSRDVINVTISCGVGSYPTTATGAQELLRLSDVALYEAKAHRNTVRTAGQLLPVAEETATTDIVH